MTPIKEYLTCSRCLKLMQNPGLLACGHSLCFTGCSYAASKEGVITCPKCFKSTYDIQPDENCRHLIELCNHESYGQSTVLDGLHLDVPLKYVKYEKRSDDLKNKLRQILDQCMEIDINKTIEQGKSTLLETVSICEDIFKNFKNKVQNKIDILSELELTTKVGLKRVDSSLLHSTLDMDNFHGSVDSISSISTADSGIGLQHGAASVVKIRFFYKLVIWLTHYNEREMNYGVTFQDKDFTDEINPRLYFFDDIDYLSLRETECVLKDIKSADLNYLPSRLHAVGETLWCMGQDNNIYIYSSEFDLLKALKLQRADTQFNSIIPDGHGNIIACIPSKAEALSQFDMNGKLIDKFGSENHYSDVTFHNNMLWALDCFKRLIINFVYNAKSNRWIENTSIKVDYDNFYHYDTIAVCDEAYDSSTVIYICLKFQGQVHKYNSSGKLLRIYTSPNHNGLYILSGVDPQGNMLITDLGGDRLLVCSVDGKWEDVHTDIDIQDPCDAVADQTGNVWVCSSGKLIKFETSTYTSPPDMMRADQSIAETTKELQSRTPGTRTVMDQSATAVTETTSEILQHLSNEIEDILFSEDGYMGICCYEEHDIIIVDIYKDDVERLTHILRKTLDDEQFKKICVTGQRQKWMPSGDPVEICKLDVSARGNIGVLAQIRTKTGTDWCVVTCKHVIGSDTGDMDRIHAIQIEDTVINNPVIYSDICVDSTGYFVDVALVIIDSKVKSVLADNIGKNCKFYCKAHGCNHVKENTLVTKTGSKTQTTYGSVRKLDARVKSFNKHRGKVCVVVGSGSGKFNVEGDSGSMVVTSSEHSDCLHVIGLISSHSEDYKWPVIIHTENGPDVQYETVHATCVVYLHNCIESLKVKYPEIQDIKIVCGEGQYLTLCK